MISELFSIIAPVLICVGIGFSWARLEQPYDMDFVTALITTIGTPCLVFTILSKVGLQAEGLAVMAAASVAALVAFTGLSVIILKPLGLSLRTYLPALAFPNLGNMGLPLSLFAFGEKGLALGIVYFTIGAVAQFTIGVGVASGAMSIKKLARIPVIYAVAVALVFMLTDMKAPAWFNTTTRLLGDMAIPMLLITLGVSLARLRVKTLKRSVVFSLLRLAMGFAVGTGLSAVFGLEGIARGVLILQSSMPTAVFSYLFAQRYNRAPEEMAGITLISTTLSFLTLPLLLWFILWKGS